MGFDWIVQAKEENGRVIEPEETAGRKYLRKNDPESVELFRKIYEERRAELKDPGPPPVQPKGPGGFEAFAEFLNGERARREKEHDRNFRTWLHRKQEYERWNRPFERVLNDFVRGSKSYVVRHAADDKQDALAAYLGPYDYYDFRCGVLEEEENAVTQYAGEALGLEYAGLLFAPERDPENMLALADEMETALKSYREAVEDQDEDSVDQTEDAIRWLRFWARNGHSIVLDY